MFTSAAGTRLTYCNVHLAFKRIVERAGLRARSTACRTAQRGLVSAALREGALPLVLQARRRREPGPWEHWNGIRAKALVGVAEAIALAAESIAIERGVRQGCARCGAGSGHDRARRDG